MLSKDVIIMWPSTAASIPTGFERENTYLSPNGGTGRYAKNTSAAGTNPLTQGGAATHTHTSSGHTHTLNSHTHTGEVGNLNCDQDAASNSNKCLLGNHHYHTYTTGASSGGTTNSTSVTYGAYSNDPAYYTVIYIKAKGMTNIPNSAVIYYKNTDTPTGFARHSASDNRFFKGSATTSSGTTGGGTTNAHAINHTHSTNTHTHVNSTSSPVYRSGDRKLADYGIDHCNSGTFSPRYDHTHPVVTGTGTQALNTYEGTKGAGTIQPLYKKLIALQNTSGSHKRTVKGMIAIWLGTYATIPSGWLYCDGTKGTIDLKGYYVKNAASTAEIGTTGGANTHTHAAESHSHTSSGSHSHTCTLTAPSLPYAVDAVGPWGSIRTHTHVDGPTAVAATYASSTTTANSSSNEPLYTQVCYIMFDRAMFGGGFLQPLINQGLKA